MTHGPTGPAHVRDQIKQELHRFYDDAEAETWLKSPQRLLGGATPDSRIGEGRWEDVWALIDQLKSGAYV